MLDDRVRAVLERLEHEDAAERAQGLPAAERARPVAPTTGRFLFALVAPQADCEVLEIGGSRGYSTIWLAAGVRQFGGRVLSLEHDPRKIDAWRRNIAEAGLEEWADLVEGDANETLPGDRRRVRRRVPRRRRRRTTSSCSTLARAKVEPGALFVADNVLSHADPLGRTRRPGRPTRRSRASPCRSTEGSR